MMKKILRVLLFTVFVMSLSQPVLGAETGIRGFWAAGSDAAAAADINDLANLPGDAVSWWYDEDSGNYNLFLPSTADLSALKIWFDADQPVFAGTAELTGNAATAAFAATGTYTLTCGSEIYSLTVMKSASVPALFLTTESGMMAHIDSSPDHSFRETGEMLLTAADGTLQYQGSLSQVKGRGNSTWGAPKKPYQIKLDKKTDLFGMGKAKTWVLLANYYDPSYLRNAIVYSLGEDLAMAFSPQYVFVDVYANHRYLGYYMLCEKTEIGENRVEIRDLEAATEAVNSADLDSYDRAGDVEATAAGTSKWLEIPTDPADISGGYLLEFDYPHRYAEEACGFVTDRGVPVVVKSPEYASEAQVSYVRDFCQELEDAIYGDAGCNGLGKHYSEYLDVESAVYRYLIEEWSHNDDGGLSSFYLYKDSDSNGDGKLHCGPVWDYDLAFANHDADTSYELTVNGMYTKNVSVWYRGLFDNADFVEEVNTVYDAVFMPAARAKADHLQRWAAESAAAIAMDEIRWGTGRQPGPHAGADFAAAVPALKKFITARTSYLESVFYPRGALFDDVSESDWYYRNVMYSFGHGYMIGVGDNRFEPEGALSRGAVITVLARLSEVDLSAYEAPSFRDVPGGAWYSAAVDWAEQEGVVSGYGDGSFRPEVSVTREELAKMMRNYACYSGEDVAVADLAALNGFVDAATVSSWAAEDVCWCVEKGLIKGMGANTLAPLETSIRAQYCAIVQRFLEN